MNLKEKIYYSLPGYLQDFALAFESSSIKNRRYSQNFFNLLNSISSRDKISVKELNQYLITRLKVNLVYANKSSEYYKSLFKKYNFDPSFFKDLSQLKMFPLQTKNEIKNHFSGIINKNLSSRTVSTHTSGTTGTGFVFSETVESEVEKWATWWRYRLNLGISLNSWCMIFGGRMIVSLKQRKPPYWKVLPALHQLSFSMYHLNPVTVKYYVEKMNNSGIEWIHGYPSTLSFLASLMKEQNLTINKTPRYITTGAENLLDHQKKIITEVLGTEPFQHYGLAEPVANISECGFHRLHIDEDYAFVELIPVDGQENLYKLIGTSLTNKALFFLRYDTNDLVSLSRNQDCPCGRNGRIIETIDGRNEDFITLKNGTKIGRLDHILKDLVNIKEAQILQNKTGDITFLIVRNSFYTESDESLLKKEIESRLDLDHYEIKYSDHIEKTKAGKLKFVISEFPSQ